jgi:hypothetical protein
MSSLVASYSASGRASNPLMEILLRVSLRNDLLDTEISHSQLTCYWIDTRWRRLV